MHFDFQFVKSGEKGNDWILFVSDKQTLANYDKWTSNPYFSQQLKIMQYTGLKDCKGKEIFEGDIIRYQNFPNKWKDPVVIIWNIKEAKFDFKDSFNGLIYNVMEVLGNIHEHPHLLEGKQ